MRPTAKATKSSEMKAGTSPPTLVVPLGFLCATFPLLPPWQQRRRPSATCQRVRTGLVARTVPSPERRSQKEHEKGGNGAACDGARKPACLVEHEVGRRLQIVE